MHPRELAARFARGENITSLLKAEAGTHRNSEEIIETAYDLQAGSYIAALSDPETLAHKQAYAERLAQEIATLGELRSVLECGVGEGTTLGLVLDALAPTPPHVHGFDLSWSRVAHARQWLANRGQTCVHLSVASLLQMPYEDDSFDVVYTSHTIEPNGGRERAALSELARVTSRYLLLLEPSWELAGAEGRARMERLGYVRDLPRHAEALGLRVVRHEAFPFIVNPLNPTAITLIEKRADAAPVAPRWACPRYGEPLEDRGDALVSPGSLRAYPKLAGIPCLRQEHGVLASAWDTLGAGGSSTSGA